MQRVINLFSIMHWFNGLKIYARIYSATLQVCRRSWRPTGRWTLADIVYWLSCWRYSFIRRCRPRFISAETVCLYFLKCSHECASNKHHTYTMQSYVRYKNIYQTHVVCFIRMLNVLYVCSMYVRSRHRVIYITSFNTSYMKFIMLD